MALWRRRGTAPHRVLQQMRPWNYFVIIILVTWRRCRRRSRCSRDTCIKKGDSGGVATFVPAFNSYEFVRNRVHCNDVTRDVVRQNVLLSSPSLTPLTFLFLSPTLSFPSNQTRNGLYLIVTMLWPPIKSSFHLSIYSFIIIC